MLFFLLLLVVVLGAALASRFRVTVLVPFSLLVGIGAAIAATFSVRMKLYIALWGLAAVFCLQFGYIAGSLAREFCSRPSPKNRAGL